MVKNISPSVFLWCAYFCDNISLVSNFVGFLKYNIHENVMKLLTLSFIVLAQYLMEQRD